MGRPASLIAWVDGAFVDWGEAVIHVDAQTVLGGLNAYEVIAGFRTDESERMCLFRLDAHLLRLEQSARMMRLPPHRFDGDAVRAAICELVERNHFREDVLIRVVHYLGAGPLFSYRSEDVSAGLFLIAKPAIADPPLARGIHVAVSSWSRLADRDAPPRIKCGANYQNARLAQIQALEDGYDDAVLLNGAGNVAELPLANIFLVRDGRLITPSVASGILEGITRRSLLELASELDIPTEERDVGRTELYIADEAFACGTGREVWPIKSVDRIAIGGGSTGPITAELQSLLADIVRGRRTHREWVTTVNRSAERAGAATWQ